jgi:site-specific DNA-methyltransferase (adenine-specific)
MDTRKIKSLIPYDKNPRKNTKAVDEVLKSLQKHGQVKPIVLSAKGKPFTDEIICAGHTTVLALKKFGAKEVKVVVKEFDSESDFVDYNIRDNKSGEFAEWDETILAELNAEFDIELDDMGFDDLVLEEDNEGETDEDEVPEVPEEPVAELGQIYKLGEHRLMCGDSTSKEAVEALMDGRKADMVYTDPPYGVSYTNNMNDNHDVIMNDDVILDFKHILKQFSKKNTHWYIWTSDPVYDQWREMYKDVFKSTVVWFKGGGGIGDLAGDYARNYEFCLFCQNGRRELNGSRDGGVWEIGKDSGSDYVHPTQKPVELSSFGIEKSCIKGDIVLDLFGGSGSTLIACEKTKRKCYMMELDPKYIDVIIKRWEDFTGKKAEVINAI